MTAPLAELSRENESEPRPRSFIVEVDFPQAAVAAGFGDHEIGRGPNDAVMLFGYHEDDQGNPPLLAPFPLRGTTVSATEEDQWLTEQLKPVYAERLNVDPETLRFPALRDFGKYISPYMRHEIGYGLMNLAEEESALPPSDRMKAALLNTGNMFLLSLGIQWQIDPKAIQELRDAYAGHFAEMLGPIPQQIPADVSYMNDALFQMRDAVSIRAAVGEMTEIFDLGHGFTYTAKQVAKRGGTTEIVHGPRVHPYAGPPVGASYLGIR